MTDGSDSKALQPGRQSSNNPSDASAQQQDDGDSSERAEERERPQATAEGVKLPNAISIRVPRQPTLSIPPMANIARLQHALIGSDALATIARLEQITRSGQLGALNAINRQFAKAAQDAIGPAIAKLTLNQQQLLNAVRPLFQQSLSRYQDFQGRPQPTTAYSKELSNPGVYFEKDEAVVDSFDDLHLAIAVLIQKNPNARLVWRGQQKASWGVHSGLYRSLMRKNKVASPESRPRNLQEYPDEQQMIQAEQTILNAARDEWRLDNINALELFARIQHQGGPTRLLDVTRNPYIAAWFAVEAHTELDSEDARLFAIAAAPVVRTGMKPPDTTVRLDTLGAGRRPFWHLLESPESRAAADWGTGAQRRLWIPPAYDQRIVAQNAGFVLDGVPIPSSKISAYLRTNKTGAAWNKSDLLAASSIYMKTSKPEYTTRFNQHFLAPTYSFRITAGAKEEIRQTLESRFSYNAATIYPDVSGLAGYLTTYLD
jgi:hypothetical protein